MQQSLLSGSAVVVWHSGRDLISDMTPQRFSSLMQKIVPRVHYFTIKSLYKELLSKDGVRSRDLGHVCDTTEDENKVKPQETKHPSYCSSPWTCLLWKYGLR